MVSMQRVHANVRVCSTSVYFAPSPTQGRSGATSPPAIAARPIEHGHGCIVYLFNTNSKILPFCRYRRMSGTKLVLNMIFQMSFTMSVLTFFWGVFWREMGLDLCLSNHYLRAVGIKEIICASVHTKTTRPHRDHPHPGHHTHTHTHTHTNNTKNIPNIQHAAFRFPVTKCRNTCVAGRGV